MGLWWGHLWALTSRQVLGEIARSGPARQHAQPWEGEVTTRAHTVHRRKQADCIAGCISGMHA